MEYEYTEIDYLIQIIDSWLRGRPGKVFSFENALQCAADLQLL
jgi:hypothetical protein